jgi:hypothetical protein
VTIATALRHGLALPVVRALVDTDDTTGGADHASASGVGGGERQPPRRPATPDDG